MDFVVKSSYYSLKKQERSQIYNVNILKSKLSTPRYALRLDPYTGKIQQI